MVTEKWRFGTAVYFCKVIFYRFAVNPLKKYTIPGFIAFTTVGYGTHC